MMPGSGAAWWHCPATQQKRLLEAAAAGKRGIRSREASLAVGQASLSSGRGVVTRFHSPSCGWLSVVAESRDESREHLVMHYRFSPRDSAGTLTHATAPSSAGVVAATRREVVRSGRLQISGTRRCFQKGQNGTAVKLCL